MNICSFTVKLKSHVEKSILLLVLLSAVSSKTLAQQTIIQYLSGTDKDHTVQWDFLCTQGATVVNGQRFPFLLVGKCRDLETYNYYEDSQNPEETSFYKHNFKVSPKYKNKRIFIVFDASMTDTKVKINGKSAGSIHQGGFYEFKYDITDLIQFDKPNLLEVTVSKRSTNASINRAERKAEFGLFGGIFRPVYLEIFPTTFIERVAIDAKANGDFNLQVFNNATAIQTIEAQVYDLKNNAIGKPFKLLSGDSMLHHHFTNIRLWNPEQPHLYYVKVSIKESGKVLHTIEQRFGFRTAALREHDGFYVNGKKVIFKGICRHSEWPESGRTLSRSINLKDIQLIKSMNMNAVRMSHYPPDKDFLDRCDSLGLFVLDELTGWQAAGILNYIG